ncbi:nucleotidyltransferase family protein [Horticoccus luteus]|uniref:Nucleotidyltransferase family protein n=1 Tax=Horticoccus luteus TaxID=2862869 RepID=A0A8F9TSW9_9BACT|nr:nucleotidyltransferase family protein [Horticoccus luteus]QYM77510.1 nucleotidyltransferase family protein [Horticoccus luteus]
MSHRKLKLRRLRPVEQLFCHCLADAPLGAGTDEVSDDELWEFACREDAQSIVGRRFAMEETRGAPRWQEAVARVRGTLTLYLQQLDRVATALATEGIPLIALKNSGIARGLFPDLAGCPMGDIDVLVSPGDFRRAHEVMKRLGFELGNRSPFEMSDIEEAEQHGGAEYTFELADGSTLWFELQWRPVAGRWIRPEQEPEADELIANSVSITGTDVRLLGPEDNLLQVCLHTAKHTFVRAPGFRLHTDVDRIARRCTIDWDQFCARVERIGVRTAVYLSLLIPKELLGTPVPCDVLERLNFAPRKHRIMLRWLEKVGWFNPNQKKWGKLGYIVFNFLLYDDVSGVVRAVFPDQTWMQERYGITSRWSLPWCYARRIADLLLKRAKT